MKLQDMLNRGFIRIENESRCYKKVTDSMVIVYDDRGNGDYDIGDFIVLHGNITPEEQIKLEEECRKQYGEIPII